MIIRQIGPGALEYRHIPARQTEKLQNLRIAALHPVFGTGGAAVMERSGIECFQTEALLCLQGIGYGKLIVDFIIRVRIQNQVHPMGRGNQQTKPLSFREHM